MGIKQESIMKGEKASLRNLVLYEVYIRNHGPNGKFADVINDLGRIKALGVDLIWLMPIHPIGDKSKKGTLGCPYSIKDYRTINPEYGTLQDFQKLIDEAHQRDLKIMIDVVYNHTAHDSTLVSERPEFFHQDEHGKPITTVPAWSDVIDLKHPNQGLQDYLIETMLYWVKLGVDGFRCDVASIIPLSFWLEAKAQVEAINPDFLWLAETVHTAWVIERRKNGFLAQSDPEMYRAFDITYDYDIWPIWQAAVQREVPVERYLEMLEFQKGIYPEDFVKLRCVENHDQPRIMALAPDESSAKAWTAFEVFNQGAFLIYAGQEAGVSQTPSLFDIDKVEWGDYRLQAWTKRLLTIKKREVLKTTPPSFLSAEPAIQAVYQNEKEALYGVFNVNNINSIMKTQLPDGEYLDLISQEKCLVQNGFIDLQERCAIILEINNEITFDPIDFTLLKYYIN
jgi:glycosidase